jgi:hypothetical protein
MQAGLSTSDVVSFRRCVVKSASFTASRTGRSRTEGG